MERKTALGITLAALLIIAAAMVYNIVPVTAPSLLQITTDKNQYARGEEVKITVKNIGDVYIEIGGYPCVMVYTHPDLKPVWPTVFAFLLWGLDPGESETWTWNQYNEYTKSFAEPGMYTVKFHGSTYPSAEVIEAFFEISGTTEDWVPYVPLASMVNLVFWTKDQTAYIDVTLTFPDAGYKVTDWGTVVKDDFEMWVDSKIWDWTGPAALVITTFRHTYDLGYLKEGTYTFTFKAWSFPVKSISFIIIRPLTATVTIEPHTLNLKSMGEWISAFIELPQGYDVSNIDASTILLESTIHVDAAAPTQVGDFDGDNVPDLMVKFSRTEVTSYIYHVLGIRYDSVTLKITGQLSDGTSFEGSDTISVNYAGDVNNDGTINILDAGEISAHWHPGPPTGPLGYNANADFNKDETVNILDAGILNVNWAQTIP